MHIPFQPSERSSLGIEWELELIDRDSRELTSGASEILEEITPVPGEEHPKAKHELLESTVEIITGICSTVAEAREDLAGTLKEVQVAAAKRNLGVMCSGTHPFTDWSTQKISPNPRYAAAGRADAVAGASVADLRRPRARRRACTGEGDPDQQRADDVHPALPGALGVLAVLGRALTPGWRRRAARSSRACRPPACRTALSGWDAFEEYMDTLISSKTIESIREVWWDIRPHPNFGTVELRICDGIPTLDEISVIAALAQSLVESFDRQLDKGYTLPQPRMWLVRENKWRAARYGLDAEIVVDDHGHSVKPIKEAILDLAEDLEPIARKLGCAEELMQVERLMDDRRQLPAPACGSGVAQTVTCVLSSTACCDEMDHGIF